MYTTDPVYAEIVAYFQSGEPLYVNPNAAAMDTLCETLTGQAAASLPGTATQLIALYQQMQDRLTNASTYFTEIQTWSSVLLPTNPLLTVAYIEDQVMECVLADFVPIIAAWQARATANVNDPTLLSDIQSFVNTQTDNLAAYTALYAAAEQAVQAMSAATSGSPNQNSMIPGALKSLLGMLQSSGAEFGTIGASPGEQYKQWLQEAGSATGPGSSVNTGTDGNTEVDNA